MPPTAWRRVTTSHRGLIASLFIGNVMLLAMNIPLVGLFARMLSVPAWVLVPFIVVVAAVAIMVLPRIMRRRLPPEARIQED